MLSLQRLCDLSQCGTSDEPRGGAGALLLDLPEFPAGDGIADLKPLRANVLLLRY